MKNKNQEFYPVALTVAGSDSGGGAGIQADLRTFNAFGVFGCSAITAVTSQNPGEVRRIDTIPAEGVRTQMAAVLDRFQVGCVKTGMLAERAVVSAVAAELRRRRLPLVVDPVMVATSGAVLLQSDAVDAVSRELLPLADWMTPNLPEAELLLGRKLLDEADYCRAAADCARQWNCRCFLKTGHDPRERQEAVDYLAMPDGALFSLASPRIDEHGAAHGTGCTLSAALAAELAMREPWKRAVCAAKAFVLGSLAESVAVGKNLEAMYPPEDDYQPLVRLEAIRQVHP